MFKLVNTSIADGGWACLFCETRDTDLCTFCDGGFFDLYQP